MNAKQSSPSKAITQTYLGAEHAIILTSTARHGFWSTVASPHHNRALWSAVCGNTGGAILADLLLLPALLHLAAPSGRLAESS